ncbi:MAG: hypothetical protein ACRELD_10210 [Longimicrobiales bacterium]
MKPHTLVVAVALAAAACAPKRIHERPILENGERTPSADDVVAETASRTAMTAQQQAARRDELTAAALAGCEPAMCDAIARGEIALGMTTRQVLAATRTTEDAWAMRNSGSATVLTPVTPMLAPRDAAGDLAMVQLRDGRVSAYSYREAHGLRVVDSAEDATTAGRSAAVAEQLLREGDDYAARGDLAAALDRYDRADVLRPNDPMANYRIATVLDKQLRPIEALIRYQLFLHQLELEKIEARGDAFAKLAEAIAYARERVIVLDRR